MREVTVWCSYATADMVAVELVAERGEDGWPVYRDRRHPAVRFAGQRGKRRAALYCALVGQAMTADQGGPIPALIGRVVAELGARPELQPTVRAAEQRATQEVRAARCHRHGGLALNSARPSCPGCRAADRAQPKGCQLCTAPHPFTRPCPDFY